jgi:hypothetical protein
MPANERRVLRVGPRVGPGPHWPVVLEVLCGTSVQRFALSSVSSWYGITDHQMTFDVDQVVVPPYVLQEMVAVGVAPRTAGI